MHPRWKRLAIAAPTTIGVCYFALWACAPMLSQTPPAPIPDGRTQELGLVGGGGSGLGVDGTVEGGPEVTAYYRGRIGRRGEGAFVLSGGMGSIVTMGFQGTHWILRDRFSLGVNGGLGWLYGSAGVPIAFRFVDGLSVYVQPGVVASMNPSYRIHGGLAIQADQVGVGVEVGAVNSVNGTSVMGGMRMSVAFGQRAGLQ